jgi:uncharacterized membrane protein
MTEGNRPGKGGTALAEDLPTQGRAPEAKSVLGTFAENALASVGDKVTQKVSDTTRVLLEKAEGEDGGGPGVKAAISGVKALTEDKGLGRAALGAGGTMLKEKVKEKVKKLFGGKGKKALKLTNIVETLDVGVPLRLAYDQWTQFEDFPNIMKKVEHVERQPEEEKSNWKAQVWWSHRAWEATVLEQVPDDHIVWRSKGAKGHVDGAVSFSELAPNLTRICLVMEYHPQGFFEHTGNLWRAQGRRARLEFKHFRRHVMAHAILNPDEIEGWRGEIRDGEVVKTHEEALEEEEGVHEEEPEQERGATEEEEEPRAEEEPQAEPGAEEEEERGEEEEPAEEPREGPGAKEEKEEPRGEEEPQAERGAEEEEERGGAREEEPRGEAEREQQRALAEEREPAEPRRARRRPSAEDEERSRPVRRRPSAEDEERSRPVRRRPSAEDEERSRPVRRRPSAEDEERSRPVRRRPSAEDQEQPRRVRRRPATDVEGRPPRERRPTERGPSEPRDRDAGERESE